MMKAITYLLAAFSLFVFSISAEPPSAGQILSQAETRAATEHKAIFVHFGASWCPWCRRLDAFLDRPDIKPVFDKYFVPIKIVVQEDDNHKALENPGGDELLQKFGGPDGLPFSAFLDAQGKLIRNSINPATGAGRGNIGFPEEPDEVDWFILMMRTAAPQISADDVQAIKSALSNPKE